MSKVICLLVGLLLPFCAAAQSSGQYLLLADKEYDAGRIGKAKDLYARAAAMNNAAAHFALAYKYVLPEGEGKMHYIAAARSGHAQALDHALDHLLFRANSFTLADPQLAYEVFVQAKKANPAMEVCGEQGKLATITKCMEAGVFDPKDFIRKNKITIEDTSGSYSIWELAGEASQGGRFGPSNTLLTLQLVCRGSNVPAEVESAVAQVYDNWKTNRAEKFEPCDYVTSGSGMAYCSNLVAKHAEEEYNKRISSLIPVLKNNAGKSLKTAYTTASDFISLKAFNEEGHDGTGRVAWANASIDTQKQAFIDFVEKVNNGFTPPLDKDKDYDKGLNETYKRIITKLKQEPITTGFSSISAEGITKVQRAWIKYRDELASLLVLLNASLTEQQWKDYLTEVRIDELRLIDGLRQ